MFQYHEKDHELYKNYNQDSSSRCSNCHTGCCAGIKNIFNKIRSYRFKKVKPKNRNLNSKLLLGDDY
jgi:hypothetical protein